MKKYWYAAQRNNEDTEWGTGSFDYGEAVKKAKEFGDESQIAVIDGGYDEDGNETTEPICVEVYRNGEDF